MLTERCKKYIENLRQVRELAKPQIMPGMGQDELIEQIQKNTLQIHDLHDENNDLLQQLVYSRVPEQFTDEDIDELEGLAGELFAYADSEDSGISYRIHSQLLKAARSRHDDAMIIRELYMCGVSLYYATINTNVIKVEGECERLTRYFREASEYLPQYGRFDRKTRAYIVRSLANRRMGLTVNTHEECRIYQRVFNRAMRVITSPRYRQLDPDMPWENFEYSMHMGMVTMLEYLRKYDDPAVAQEVLFSAEYVYHHNQKGEYLDEENRLQNWRITYFYNAALYHAGLASAEDVVKALLDIVEKLDPEDDSPDSINNSLTTVAVIKEYWSRVESDKKKEYEERVYRAIQRSWNYLDSMKGSRHPRVVSIGVRNLIDTGCVENAQDQTMMLNYMLAAHKPTYVHSLMVAKLTRILVERILDTKPEQLTGLLGYNTKEQLTANRDEILKSAYNCGLYHDIGKSIAIMQIDTNARDILDEEFECIQYHAKHGHWLMSNLKREDLATAALYHHRFYNNAGGYPENLSPCPQKYKGIIDALAVADSVDAATDDIGRSYKRAKDFETLLGELYEQQGTRYAPYVVGLFDDEEFRSKIKSTLSTERRSVYAAVYHAQEKHRQNL